MNDQELNKILLENRKMRIALERVDLWDLPKAEIDGVPCSYGIAYGSNGERDYIRNIAREALS